MSLRDLIGILTLLAMSGWCKMISTDSLQRKVVLNSVIEVALDQSGALDIDQIRSGQLQFHSTNGKVPSWGYTPASAWGQFDLQITTPHRKPLLLELEMPLLDHVDFWIYQGDSLIDFFQTGYSKPFNQRPIEHRNFVFKISQQQSGIFRIYLRIRSVDRLEMPLQLWNEHDFLVNDQRTQFYSGGFFGLVISAIVLSFLMFITFKDLSYLYYSLFLTLFSFFVAGQIGYVHEYLWPTLLTGKNHYMHVCILVILVTQVLLTQAYLDTEKNHKRLHQVLQWILRYVVACIVISPVLSLHHAYILAVGSVVIVMGSIFTISAVAGSKSKAARYYLLGWSVALMAGMLYAFKSFALLPSDWIPVESLAFVWLIQFIIISLGLGERLLQIRLEKESLQKGAIDSLKQANVLKDEFLANTSHELRTPLNGIIGIAESLVDGATGPLQATVKENLQLIIGSGKRLANLVNDILDLSRLKNGEITIKQNAVDIAQVAKMILGILNPLAYRKNIRLSCDISNEFPFALGDEDRIQQIFHNLLGNAIKFTHEGEVRISASLQNDRIQICVADTGIGIDQSRIQDVFEGFNQVDGSASRSYGGAGLGLSLSRHLIQLHGGSIWVESKINEGSKFYFTLPIAKDAVKPVASENKTVAKVISIQDALGLDEVQPAKGNNEALILVVDDEPINLKILVKQLTANQYRVITASNGIDALRMLEQKALPDLILLDVMMPRMSGYEVCRRIRERWDLSILPVIMVTAKNQVSDLVEGLESGANDYLTKPFTSHELLARVKAHIALSKINHSYARFVPQQFLKQLGREDIVQVRLGDHVERDMTVFFSDIRSFFNLSESMTAEENFNFLNSYLGRVAPLISENGGFIDKYVGEGMMALFPESPAQAVHAAILIVEEIERYNIHRSRCGYRPIEVGIGLHCGSLMLGTIGESARMDGTVIADAVNIAARLEQLNREFGTTIIVSDVVYNQMTDEHRSLCRSLGDLNIRGKLIQVRAYEVFAGDPLERRVAKQLSREHFEQAVYFVDHQKNEDAIQSLHRVLEMDTADTVAMALLHRIQRR